MTGVQTCALPIYKVKAFEGKFLEELRSNHSDILSKIAEGEFNDGFAQKLTEVASKISSNLA